MTLEQYDDFMRFKALAYSDQTPTEILFSYLAPLLGDLERYGVDIKDIDWQEIANSYGHESERIEAEQALMQYLDI